MNELALRPQLLVDGGSEAEVLRDAVASADMDGLELLVREVLQNSNDARRDDAITVGVDFYLRKFAADQLKSVFLGVESCIESTFLQALSRDLSEGIDIEALCFVDRGTSGLNGPVSVEDAALEKRFANFFQKTGRAAGANPNDGGSRGHGRGVLFVNSRYSTVLAYTQFEQDGERVERFIGMTIDVDFVREEKCYSGKWFVSAADNARTLPLVGAHAQAVARSLGLSEMLGSDTGTVLVMLGPKHWTPEVREPDLAETLVALAEKYVWPHFAEVRGSRSIAFRVIDSHGAVYEPDVSSAESAIASYIKMYEKCERGESGEFSPQPVTQSAAISLSYKDRNYSLAASAVLGSIRHMITMRPRVHATGDSQDGLLLSPSAIRETISGIALFRSPRLVVTYRDCPQLGEEYKLVGYFVSTKQANPFFMVAEDVTHDKWIPNALQNRIGRGKANPVNRVDSALEALFKKLVPSAPRNDSSAATLGRQLGAALGFKGVGKSKKAVSSIRSTKPPTISSRTRLAADLKVLVSSPPSLRSSGHAGYIGEFHFKVSASRPLVECGQSLRFRLHVSLVGGRTEEVDEIGAVAEGPRVVAVESNGLKVSDCGELPVSILGEEMTAELVVVVASPSDINVTCSVSQAKAKEGEVS